MYTVLLTGLPCSGKTTLGRELVKRLDPATHLDGDEMRAGLCEDLGFSVTDRAENLRRIGHICRLFNRAGVIVVATFVAPLQRHRAILQQIIPDLRIAYLDCPVDVCEGRDVKGMYALARRGAILNFTGIDSEYEVPEDADAVVDTTAMISACMDTLMGIVG